MALKKAARAEVAARRGDSAPLPINAKAEALAGLKADATAAGAR